MPVGGNTTPTGQTIPLVGYGYKITGLTSGQKNTVTLSGLPPAYVANGAIVLPNAAPTNAAAAASAGYDLSTFVSNSDGTATIDLYPMNYTACWVIVF